MLSRLDINPKPLAGEGAGLFLRTPPGATTCEDPGRLPAKGWRPSNHLTHITWTTRPGSACKPPLRGGHPGLFPLGASAASQNTHASKTLLATTRQDTSLIPGPDIACTAGTAPTTVMLTPAQELGPEVLCPCSGEQNPQDCRPVGPKALRWQPGMREMPWENCAAAAGPTSLPRKAWCGHPGTDFLWPCPWPSYGFIRQLVEGRRRAAKCFEPGAAAIPGVILRASKGPSWTIPGKVRVTYRRGRLTARKSSPSPTAKGQAANLQKGSENA